MTEPCGFVIRFGDEKKGTPTVFCDAPSVQKYPTYDGGSMYLCKEHSMPAVRKTP